MLRGLFSMLILKARTARYYCAGGKQSINTCIQGWHLLWRKGNIVVEMRKDSVLTQHFVWTQISLKRYSWMVKFNQSSKYSHLVRLSLCILFPQNFFKTICRGSGDLTVVALCQLIELGFVTYNPYMRKIKLLCCPKWNTLWNGAKENVLH